MLVYIYGAIYYNSIMKTSKYKSKLNKIRMEDIAHEQCDLRNN